MGGDPTLEPSHRLRRDIGRHLRGAILLVVIGSALGVALVPRGDELLLIYVRNRDIDQARQVLAAREAHGVSTVSSVVAHGELFLLEGHVDEALRDLEAFVTRQPDNAAAWRRLARLYQYAQRLEDQTRALAEVYRLDRSPDLARQLAVMYRWTGDGVLEAARLHDLVAEGQATVDEELQSARLDAALGHRDVALATMERLADRQPEVFAYAELELFASLLVDAGNSSALAARVQRLPLVLEEPALLTQLAATMRRWGWTTQAVQLFAAPGKGAVSPTILAGRARAAEGSEVAPDVLRGLLQVDAVHALADEPLEETVRLALSLRDDEAVDRLFAHRGKGPAVNLVGLAIGAALSHGARARAQALVVQFGDEGLVDSPLLALELAVERGDRRKALAWIARMDATGLTDPLEAAAVSQLETRLGLEAQAFERLARLVRAGGAPGWAYSDLTSLAVRLARVDNALHLLAPEPASAVDAERRRAWAKLAANERPDLLKTWLSGNGIGLPDADALRDAYYLRADRDNADPDSTNHDDAALAAALAERLFAVRGAPDDAVLLGHALVAAGRPADALAPLRASGLRTVEARAAYDTALAHALAEGDDPTGDIRATALATLREERAANLPVDRRRMLVEALWAAGERVSLLDDVMALAGRNLDGWLSALVESATAGGRRSEAADLIAHADGGLVALEERRRTDRVRALVELDAADRILLPELRRLAYQAGEGWVSIYDEQLARTARTSEQVELWARVGLAPATPAAGRRAAASRLIDLDARASAASVFERLAEGAGPGDPDVQQLLFLWGSPADERQVNWLMSRLYAAPLEDRAAWMTHVSGAGGASRIVVAFPQVPGDASPALAAAWLDAHRKAGNLAALRQAIFSTIEWADAGTDALRHAGRTALAENLPAAAAAAFRLVAAREPDDRESARWVGTLAFYERRTDEARRFLTAYEALGGDEPEPIFQLGELAREDRRPAEARDYYQRALTGLSDTGAGPVPHALLANVFVRLDERVRAVDAFEALLRETPGNDHVRADFASALLQWGDYDRAWRVLEEQPRLAAPAPAPAPAPAAAAAAADAGGTRRLDLLRLQWLNFEGRYADALRLIETLEARFPADVDVRLARASFDGARGRLVQADAQYVAVGRDAPDRVDVAAMVRAREQQRAPHASVQVESRNVSAAWSAGSTLVSLDGRVSQQVALTLVAERLDLQASQVLSADGRIGALAKTLTRFEAGMAMPLAPGTTVSAALFGTTTGAGAGATFERYDLRGRWKATAERGRPFWELVESVAGDGRKDRLGIQRDWRFSADTAGWAVLDSNHYRLASGPSATTAALTLGFIRTVKHGAPTLTLQYGMDKEHVRDATRTTAPDGRIFTPIPLVSREVHLAGAVTRFPVWRLWDVDASAGYTVDRFGGRGSFLTARATPNPATRVGLELWGERRLYSLATTQQALRGGTRVTVRF